MGGNQQFFLVASCNQNGNQNFNVAINRSENEKY
jgi:hypothetical protein